MTSSSRVLGRGNLERPGEPSTRETESGVLLENNGKVSHTHVLQMYRHRGLPRLFAAALWQAACDPSASDSTIRNDADRTLEVATRVVTCQQSW